MARVALDLFCGSGAATAAFRRAGWDVVAVDLAASSAATVVADVCTWDGRPPADFIWASPPCQEFSLMPLGSRDRRPSLECVFAAMRIIRDVRPRFWIIENVVGAIPFLGAPLQKVGAFCLWGYFPRIDAPIEAVLHRKLRGRTAAERSRIPWSLAVAVHEAVERGLREERILDLRQYRRHRHIAALAGRRSS